MTKLIINNDYSYLLTSNTDIKNILYSSLRFREKNYFHNRRYKMKLWDGYTDFFQKDTGKFLSGLLPEIKAVLKKKDVKYVIEDNRTKTEFLYESIDKDFGKKWHKDKKIDLYDYQIDFINQVIKYNRGVIFAPTSSGKSATMVGILKTIKPTAKILILQNRVGLASQNYEEIKSWGFNDVGRLWSGKNEQSSIVVASVQSIGKIEKQLGDFEVLIVDEIHDMMSKLPKAVYRRLKKCSIRIAMSATPFKFGETDKVQKYYVKGFFGPVLKTSSTEDGILSTSNLQKRKILSKSNCVFYEVNEPKDIKYDIYLDAVTRGIAENHHFHKMVKEISKSLSGRTLILVDRIAHGDMLKNMIPESLWIQGKDNLDTRKEVVSMLQKSEECIAIATQQIFNTGINVFIHNLINAAGGQADHQIIQRIGRGLRTAKDKDILNYFDFLFKTNHYLENHSKKRIKILEKQGHKINIKTPI